MGLEIVANVLSHSIPELKSHSYCNKHCQDLFAAYWYCKLQQFAYHI